MMRDLCRLSGPESETGLGGTNSLRSRVIQGVILAAGIAATARRVNALSTSGAAAAMLVGAAVHAGMGARGSITLIGYFVSSSALGRLPKPGQPVQHRGNRRDAVQVLANGGPAAVFSILRARLPAASNELAATAFYGSIAAAAADTWATEAGTRWGGRPRNIVTGRLASSGESGAVTPAGLASSLAASLVIAAAARIGEESRGVRAMSCAAGGMVGSISDSLLGACIQEQRWCERCGVRSELPIHICGHHTRHIAGVPGVNNDVVNLLAVIAGGFTAVAVSYVLPKLTEHNGSRVEFVTTLTNSGLPSRIGAP